MNGTDSRKLARDARRRVMSDPRYGAVSKRVADSLVMERRAKNEYAQALTCVPFDGVVVASAVATLTAAVQERKDAETARSELVAEHSDLHGT